LDDDCQAITLATALREHGVDVRTTNEAGLSGALEMKSSDVSSWSKWKARWGGITGAWNGRRQPKSEPAGF
jgi:hypothetical protein